MKQAVQRKRDVQKVADIILDAGGRVVGRTRLQKIGYILELAGLGDGFAFEFRHYGPYSEELAAAARNARLLGLIQEEEQVASWGGLYSIFTASGDSAGVPERVKIACLAANADPIELELAATAAFLAASGEDSPWEETAKRKRQKAASGRLRNAKVLYEKLRQIKTPKRLPSFT